MQSQHAANMTPVMHVMHISEMVMAQAQVFKPALCQ